MLCVQATEAESEWHKEQQQAVRHKVQNTAGLNVKTYAETEEACDAIKEVG